MIVNGTAGSLKDIIKLREEQGLRKLTAGELALILLKHEYNEGDFQEDPHV